MAAADIIQSITSTESDTYRDTKDTWARNETVFFGTDETRDLLMPFTWERSDTGITTPDTAGYEYRKDRAVVVPFGSLMQEKFNGSLQERAPKPGAGIYFGTLGEVRPDVEGDLTLAEELYYNADGTGSDAAAWDTFWFSAMAHAMATNVVYVLTEHTEEAAVSKADQLQGARPYLVKLSPRDVPYVVYERGTLHAARVLTSRRVRGLDAGRYVDREELVHYVMTRRGWQGFGEPADTGYDFRGGGWWMFDKDGLLIERDGMPMFGTWDTTNGEIPLTRLFYERGTMRRGGATQVNNITLSFMDVLSWMWYDTMTSGSRKRFLMGIEASTFDTFIDQIRQGATDVPLPGDAGGRVSIYDTGQVSANAALEAYAARLLDLASKYFIRELTTSPDASGAAKKVELLQGNSPRLAHMAANLEEAQRATLIYCEQRGTGTMQPMSNVRWPRHFDLSTTQERIERVVNVFRLAGKDSPTLMQELLTDAVQAAGLISEGREIDWDRVKAEIGGVGLRQAALADRRANIAALAQNGQTATSAETQ